MPATKTLFHAALVAAGLCALTIGPAGAVSTKECSAKYKAAKADGSLGGQNWKSFRSTHCTTVASTAATPTTSAATATAPAPATGAASGSASAGPATKSAGATATATGPATFPSAVDPKYSKETAGKARLHTCLDQYKANKASGGNGGLRWVQKGGGYYSACSKKLKG